MLAAIGRYLGLSTLYNHFFPETETSEHAKKTEKKTPRKTPKKRNMRSPPSSPPTSKKVRGKKLCYNSYLLTIYTIVIY